MSNLKGGGKLKRSFPNNTRWMLLLILLCGVACSHTESTCCNFNQVFRGQWDDYYLRALSCIEQANFQQALSDFQASLDRRPPSKKYDRRMVRTYGMHYLDYFPNRETGFIYFLQHQYEKALEYLNRSIQSEPSAKAYYFRNQVQKQLQTSISQPSLALTEPCVMTENNGEIWQSESNIIIRGTAYDSQLIEAISIQERPLWIDFSAKKVDFFQKMHLEEGRHPVSVQATNISGAMTQKNIIFHVDQTGPSISVEKGILEGTIIIHAQDRSKQLALIIDQDLILSVNQSTLNYTFKWPSKKSEIFVCVRDRCENQTCATITHSQLFHIPQFSGLIAENKNIVMSDTGFSQNPSVSDSIEIVFDQQDLRSVFSEKISISGKISSTRSIVSVEINHTPLPIQSGKCIYFSRQIQLNAGQNQVNVLAKTISGQLQRKIIQIYRKIPSVLQFENRYGLSMYPFNVNGQDQSSWVDNLFGMTHKSGQASFELTESFERNFVKVLHERHRFRINNLGQLVTQNSGSIPCQGSLLGNAYVSKFGLEITARIVDNQTSAVLGIKDVYRENTRSIDIEAMALELSEKIHRSFPLIQGKIKSKIENGYWFECQDALPKVAWPILVYQIAPDSDTTIIGKGSISPGNHLNQMGLIVIDKGAVHCGDWIISR